MGMNGFILIDINRKISKIFRKPISRTFTLQDCCGRRANGTPLEKRPRITLSYPWVRYQSIQLYPCDTRMQAKALVQWNCKKFGLIYQMTELNVTHIWIKWASRLAMGCMANSPFPGYVSLCHPVLFHIFKHITYLVVIATQETSRDQYETKAFSKYLASFLCPTLLVAAAFTLIWWSIRAFMTLFVWPAHPIPLWWCSFPHGKSGLFLAEKQHYVLTRHA